MFMTRKPASDNKRQYQGEPQGSGLAAWLNTGQFPGTRNLASRDKAIRKSAARVAHLVALFQAAWPSEESSATGRVSSPEQYRLNKALARYHFGIVPSYEPGKIDLKYIAKRVPLTTAWAIAMLLDLVRQELIHNFRRCLHCNAWFFAHHSAQKFCPGGKCSDIHRKSSPEYKEYHRTLMRRRYHVQKLRKGKR
jgi:hypothetical protein